MNRGKLRLVIKQGSSTIKSREFYPFWKLEVIGPKGERADVAPSYPELKEILIQILTHEFLVDRAIGRRPDFTKCRRFIKTLAEDDLVKEAQMRISHFRKIPTIYTDFVKIGYEEDFEKIWKIEAERFDEGKR